MVDPGDRLLPSRIRPHLATASLGRRLYYYPATASTNDIALAMARAGEPEGAVVLTDEQYRGRGRHGHSWTDQAGRDLTFSLVLRPQTDAKSLLPVTLVMSLALSVTLSRATGAGVGVKWPNDLVAAQGKVGGILAEASHRSGAPEFVVVGIGINVNGEAAGFPADLGATAVSCRMLCGAPLDRAALFGEALGMVEAYYLRFCRDGFGPLVSAYEERLLHRGRTVRFARGDAQQEGEIIGVGDDGALHVAMAGSGERLPLYNEVIEVLP